MDTRNVFHQSSINRRRQLSGQDNLEIQDLPAKYLKISNFGNLKFRQPNIENSRFGNLRFACQTLEI